MRIVLLLIVVAAIGIAVNQFLKASVPRVPPPGASEAAAGPAAAPASREALRQFGEDVNRLTQEGAAERARRSDEASR